MTTSQQDLKRWRLILGGTAADDLYSNLSDNEATIDNSLEFLYGDNLESDKASLEASSPKIAKWLGDIRKYFPSNVVQVIQKDAIDRLGLEQLLLEPEVLSQVEADIHMVSTLMSLNRAIPENTKETARGIVKKLVDELIKKLEQPTKQSIEGSLSRNLRNLRPKLKEIDWNRTIKANLSTYQPKYKTIIPEKLIGFGRKQSSLKDVILCIDQSGSMAPSVIYSSIFGAVMASMPALSTRFVLFDTSVVDLTENLEDPVDILFGTQLSGGTDINKALTYCEKHITRPTDTVMILISDLEEGGNQAQMIKTAKRLHESGVQLITLLALSNEGKPSYCKANAGHYTAMGIPVFACTPDLFPDLMAAALNKKDLQLWANSNGIRTQ